MSKTQNSLNKSLDEIIKEKSELKKQQARQQKITSARNAKSFRSGGRKDFGNLKGRSNKLEFLRNKQFIKNIRQGGSGLIRRNMGGRLSGYTGSGRGLRRQYRLAPVGAGGGIGTYKPLKKFINFENANNSKPAATSDVDNFNQLEKRRLFVSNLTHSFVNDDLNSLFSDFGPLKTCRIHWDKLGRSKGTAVVEYESTQHAAEALKTFDGASIDGMKIKVEYDPMVKKKMQESRVKNRFSFMKKAYLLRKAQRQITFDNYCQIEGDKFLKTK